MAIANLTELFGNSSANTNTIPNLSVYYGLGGDDNLSSPSGNSNSFPVVVAIGGAGNDVYTVWNNSTLIVWDSSSSGSDRLVATGIPLITGNTIGANYGGIIDNRHLWVGNTVSGQEIIILDWQNQRNRLETINLQDGDFSYDFIAETIPTLGLPSYSWSSAVAAGLDLSKLGLNSSHVNTAIEQIKNRSLEIQQPDFSDDGKSDILLNNPSQGWNSVWFLNGTTYSGFANLPSAPGWQSLGTGDFNGDSKPDILLNNINSNWNTVWLMNGTNYVDFANLPTAPAGWQIAGMA